MTKTKTKTKKSDTSNASANIPSVLACEKKLVPSDGYMYGTIWKERHDVSKRSSLKITQKSVRGTISNRLDNTKDFDINAANLHTVDISSLEEHQDTLILNFTLQVLSGVEKFSVCNDNSFADTYFQKTKGYIKEYGFKELAKRYATNLANARFLWRNRVGAQNIEVQIKILEDETSDKTEQIYTFDALKIGLNNFDFDNADITNLSHLMAETLSGKNDSLILDVTAFAKIGRAQDVYPSEELVLKENSLTKRKYSKSKFLYYRNGGAAMHSQKIGNAIRKIDTWYNQENQCTPIPIEVYGSVTQLGEAFRRNKNDFYTIFDSWMLSDEVISKEEQHYCMAMLVRGGIFGEKDKTKNKKEDSSE